MERKIIFILFLCVLSSGYCQINSNEIQGSWIASSELVDGVENKTIEGDQIEIDLKFHFEEDILNICENGILTEGIKYRIINEKGRDILKFGNRLYYIQKLDSLDLILEEKNSILNSRLIFKKDL